MHDRATTHDEFCSPDRNVISDCRVGVCVWAGMYTRSSAIADKPRDAGLYSCLGMAGLFVSICRQKVHEHMLQTVN